MPVGDAENYGPAWETIARNRAALERQLEDPESELSRTVDARQAGIDSALEILDAWFIEEDVAPEEASFALKDEHGLDLAIFARRHLGAIRIERAQSAEFEALCSEVEAWPEARVDRLPLMLVIESERARRGLGEPVNPTRAEVARRTRKSVQRF